MLQVIQRLKVNSKTTVYKKSHFDTDVAFFVYSISAKLVKVEYLLWDVKNFTPVKPRY